MKTQKGKVEETDKVALKIKQKKGCTLSKPAKDEVKGNEIMSEENVERFISAGLKKIHERNFVDFLFWREAFKFFRLKIEKDAVSKARDSIFSKKAEKGESLTDSKYWDGEKWWIVLPFEEYKKIIEEVKSQAPIPPATEEIGCFFHTGKPEEGFHFYDKFIGEIKSGTYFYCELGRLYRIKKQSLKESNPSKGD
jgi:hypothetical protein